MKVKKVTGLTVSISTSAKDLKAAVATGNPILEADREV
jgi:hypothetical protein